MGLNKYTIKCIHSYGIIQSSFTTLKILCSIYSFLSAPKALAISNLFTLSGVLPFPECHIVSLSYMHLIFLYVFSWLDNSFLFSTNWYSLSGGSTVYIFIYSRTSWLLPSFSNYEYVACILLVHPEVTLMILSPFYI